MSCREQSYIHWINVLRRNGGVDAMILDDVVVRMYEREAILIPCCMDEKVDMTFLSSFRCHESEAPIFVNS